MKLYSLLLICSFIQNIHADNNVPGSFCITRIEYNGGGDWYADPSSIPNLLQFLKKNTNLSLNMKEQRTKIGDDIFFKNNYFYITGHGNIKLNDDEIQLLRDKLLAGAFLHADDNYGMDKSFRLTMQKVFPEKEMIEIPYNHPIFNIYYPFTNGLPKIHEHNNQRPQAFGIYHNNEIIVLYTFETDLGDGWEDITVHNNSIKMHNKALEMGTNIILYALSR